MGVRRRPAARRAVARIFMGVSFAGGCSFLIPLVYDACQGFGGKSGQRY